MIINYLAIKFLVNFFRKRRMSIMVSGLLNSRFPNTFTVKNNEAKTIMRQEAGTKIAQRLLLVIHLDRKDRPLFGRVYSPNVVFESFNSFL